MNLTGPMNEKQIARLHQRWAVMARRGPALHTLIFGTALFLWMCFCYVSFMYLGGRLRLLHEPFVLYSTLPCLLLLAYAAPISQYWAVKQMVSRTTAAKA